MRWRVCSTLESAVFLFEQGSSSDRGKCASATRQRAVAWAAARRHRRAASRVRSDCARCGVWPPHAYKSPAFAPADPDPSAVEDAARRIAKRGGEDRAVQMLHYRENVLPPRIVRIERQFWLRRREGGQRKPKRLDQQHDPIGIPVCREAGKVSLHARHLPLPVGTGVIVSIMPKAECPRLRRSFFG